MIFAQNLAEAFSAAGFQQAFGVSGANIESFFYALGQRTELLLAKHEASAISMAEGYFRVTGKPGLVLTTSGGGAFHTLAPLAEALASEVPLLVVVGQIASDQEGHGGFQDSSGQDTRIDAEKIFSNVTVAVRKIRALDQVQETLDFLIHAAIQERGPAVLLVPRELWSQPLAKALAIVVPDCALPQPPVSVMERIQESIQRSSQILVLAGKDILFHGWQKPLHSLVQKTGAWIALTPDAKGLWDHDAPEFVGLVGSMGHGSTEAALAAADLILVIGTRLPLMSRPTLAILHGKELIQLHSRSGLSFKWPHFSWQGDIGSVLSQVSVQPRCMTSVPQRPELLRVDHRQAPATMPMQDAIACLAAEFPSATDVFVDAGNIGAAVIHSYPQRGHSIFAVALGMGGMGHSFGCAIGATAARKKRSLVLAGDGSFYMYGLEIHTAWEHQLPITFVIFNNNAHAMCQMRERIYLGPPACHNQFRPSFPGAGLRAMLPGLPAFDVNSLEELQARLLQMREIKGPAVLSIQTDPNEPPPFLPFLNTEPRHKEPS